MRTGDWGVRTGDLRVRTGDWGLGTEDWGARSNTRFHYITCRTMVGERSRTKVGEPVEPPLDFARGPGCSKIERKLRAEHMLARISERL